MGSATACHLAHRGRRVLGLEQFDLLLMADLAMYGETRHDIGLCALDRFAAGDVDKNVEKMVDRTP